MERQHLTNGSWPGARGRFGSGRIQIRMYRIEVQK
jgi:hypothetical protein